MLKHLVIFLCIATITNQKNVNVNTIFNASDFKCLSNGTVYYLNDRKCYNLLEKGPCSSQEWLVLDTARGNILKATCKPCPCCKESSKKVFWPKDGLCHRTSDRVCPFGNKLINDFDGQGNCVCKDGYAKVLNSQSQECYPLFERSTVCSKGKYLQLSSTVDEVGKCVNNPCQDDGIAPWTENNQYFLDNVHCYQLNTQGPCSDSDQLFRVLPNDPTLVGCFSPAFSILQIPTLCSRAVNGHCRPPVTFSGESAKPMMSKKMQAFLKRKRIETDDLVAATTTSRVQTLTSEFGPSSQTWAWD